MSIITHYVKKSTRSVGRAQGAHVEDQDAVPEGAVPGRDRHEDPHRELAEDDRDRQGQRQDEDALRAEGAPGACVGVGGELEAAEGRAAGAERAAEVGVPAGDRPSGGWRWRRPAPPPDESACLEEFEPFVARWSRVLNPAFGRIPDFRKRERCAYDAGTIAWTVLLGMFLRRKSRVRMDSDRNSREYAESVLRISGQDLAQWPEGEPYHAPSSQTCCYLLRRTPSSGLLDALSGMVGAAIRSKFLDGARDRKSVV